MKKKYTVAQRKEFHTERVKSAKATHKQKLFSKHWLDGFNDEHADHNLAPTKNELKQRKAYVSEKEKELKNAKEYNTTYVAYIRGATARLNK